MNNISEQLLQAMDIVMDQKLTQLQYDKTIQAKIYSVVDIDIGEYKVRYNGNIFSAFSNDTSKTYKVNDAVYVSVPEGNFSNKKLITSLVTANSLSSSQLSDLSNSMMEVSPTFDILYDDLYDTKESYGVIAGTPVGGSGSYTYIYQGPDIYSPNGYHGLFQQYSNNYEYIRVKASFLTQFYNIHNQGNYGLEVEFYTKDGSSVKYKLDLQNFNGNAYNFSVYTPQEIILKAQKNYLMGLKSIKLFEEDFVYDKIVENGIVTDKENTTVANIFVKDIVLQYVDKKDLSDTTYYLTISASKGIAFTDKINSLNLIGRLIYKGADIMDSKKCACQWYERDLSVMVGVDGYNKSAGFGWKKIEGATSDTLTLNAADIIYQQKYKLVVVYNNNITLTAETELWNHNASYSYAIEQVTDGADIKLQIKNNLNNESLVGDWYLSYPDGSYSSVQEGKNKSEITVSPYLQYSSVVFYCTVYNAVGEFIGTLEHTIYNSEDEDDVTISYVGDDTFRYDANGDVSIEDAEKERTLQVNLAWKEGFGTSYFVSWLMKDAGNKEHELPTSKDLAYNPENSMIENLWVDNYNILHYNIKQKYKINFNNNTIIVKIRTITESVYSFNKEILCLKDGDQGTNGTTYITAVRPCNRDGVKLSGLQPLRYNGGWVDNIRVRCYVYKDGEMINDNSKYSISYKWQGTNVTVENREYIEDSVDQVLVRGIPTISANTSSAELAFYVKVQVTIKDDNSTVDIYASYPLDVIVGATSANAISIDSIPSYIKYNSSGLTPSFYSNDINFYYNNVAYNDNITSLNTKILTIKTSDGKKYLEPASSFIFENIKDNKESNIGVLNLAIPNSMDRLIHPIIMYLDTYGNEAINGWDGTALDTGEGEYVFAPQIGAGTKDSANKFTGVVMGKDSGQDKIGLYGYQKGVNTFGLMEDGTAFFGAKSGGGQIIINGKSGHIEGGGGGDSPIGMTIVFADLNPGKNTDAIKIGGGVFKVSYDGTLNATSAEIEGTIYAKQGKIGCSSKSSSDGWIIQQNKLYSGNGSNHVELNSNAEEEFAMWAGSNDSASAKNSKFAVSKKGELYAKEGNIGGWQMMQSYLKAISGTVGMASSGSAAFWAGSNLSQDSTSIPSNSSEAQFLVTRNGKLYCTSADISGRITADSGTIGGWTIQSNYLTSDSGNTILWASGAIDCDDLACSGGTIGGWKIRSNYLNSKSGDTTLWADGEIECDNLTCSGGTIGGWIIGPDTLTSEDGATQLRANDPDGVSIHTSYGDIGLIIGSQRGEDGVTETTYNFGMQATGGDGSVIIQATFGNGNVALRASDYIILNGDKLSCTIDAEKQYGIYARFA